MRSKNKKKKAEMYESPANFLLSSDSAKTFNASIYALLWRKTSHRERNWFTI